MRSLRHQMKFPISKIGKEGRNFRFMEIPEVSPPTYFKTILGNDLLLKSGISRPVIAPAVKENLKK